MPLADFSKSILNAHHHLISDKDLGNEHAALYLTQTLRVFAINLIGVFLPIYIFINSESYLIFHADKTINGVIWALSYMMLRSLGLLVFAYFLSNLIFTKIHLNRSIVLSLMVQIIEIIFWLLAKDNMYLMLVAGFLSGLKVTLYWIPYHIYFVKKFKGGSYGKNTGKRYLYEKFVTGIAPVIGGFMIASFGFESVFFTSILLLLSAGMPVLLTVHEWKHHEHNVSSVIKNFVRAKKYKLMSLAYFGEGADAAVFTIGWPILLYIGIQSFVKIGTLTSVTTVIAAFTAFAAGRAMDKHGSRVIHAIGVFFNSIFHILRVFVSTSLGLYIVDIVDRLNGPLYSLPNMALSYEKAKRSKSGSDYIIYRELMIHFSIMIVCTALILVLSRVGVWRWMFLIAAFGSSLTYLMDLDKN